MIGHVSALRSAHCQLRSWRPFRGLCPRAGAGLAASFSLSCGGAPGSAALERFGLFWRFLSALIPRRQQARDPITRRSLQCRRRKMPEAFFKTCKHKGVVNILNTLWKAEVYLEKCPVVIGSIAVWRLISTRERKVSKAQGSMGMFYECFSGFFSLSFENLWQFSVPIFLLNVLVFLKSATWRCIFFFF